MDRSFRRRIARRAVCAVLGVGCLGACSTTVVTHGYQLDERRMAQVTPGVTNRQQVAELLGTPSALATFDDQNWYYISQRYERANFYLQDLVAQDVYTITFDTSGIVSDINKRDMQAAQAIKPDPDATRTLGNELTIVEQFLGNLGRFNTDKTSQPGQSNSGRSGGGV